METQPRGNSPGILMEKQHHSIGGPRRFEIAAVFGNALCSALVRRRASVINSFLAVMSVVDTAFVMFWLNFNLRGKSALLY